MNALVALLALSGSFAENNIPAKWTPTWQNDYRQAKLQASEAGKPLAVFIGTGKTGWETIAREGTIDEKAVQLLKAKYVCVYIDAETSSGHKLAEAFEVKNKGLIISDRTGNSEAFYHSGDLSQTDLTKALEKYSDANRNVVSTETIAEVAPVAVPAPQPVSVQPYQMGTIRYYGTAPAAGSCPNCR